jgi:hypothetical protein
VDTRSLLTELGFQQDWESITDAPPAYYCDFGNLRLTAAQVLSRFYEPVFLFGGVMRNERSIQKIQFEMPLEIESFAQGVAWITCGLGRRFVPRLDTPWLDVGWQWQDLLPWERERKAYADRPKCEIKKDWLRLAIKELRPLASAASEDDLLWLAFDGEVLRFTVREKVVLIPAIGTAWDKRYAIKARQLDHLPKRLSGLVEISVWGTRLSVDNRGWELAATTE